MKLEKHYLTTLGILILVSDQLIKHNIRNPILNTGAGFGIFEGQRWILVLISAIIICALIFFYYKTKEDIIKTSLMFIILGASSNLIDRFFLGYVMDYLPFPFWPTFPTYNLGDVMICFGIGLLILNEFYLKRKKAKSAK